MTRSTSIYVLLAIASLSNAGAAVIQVPSAPTPLPVNEIGAAIRWGATGWEASLRDGSVAVGTPLNPTGTPVWVLNRDYNFQIQFSSLTGVLSLSVDFDGLNGFDTSETVSRNTFTAPTQTNYAGFGFGSIRISGFESGSTGRSRVTALSINGTSLSNIVPNGGNSDQNWYINQNSGLLTSINISGKIAFTSAGTGEERPSWTFSLNNASPIPEPGMMSLLGLGLGGIFALRRSGRI